MSAPRPIIFDLGCVVVEWQPELLIASVPGDEALRARVRAEIFQHPDWLEIDRGIFEEAVVVQGFARRTGLTEAQVTELLDRVPPSLTPKEDTLALIRALHAAGHPLYFLSNMAHASIEYLESHHDFWPLFTGGVVSCRVGLLKPEAAIYEHLLATCGLRARDAIFIDDLQPNVDAAAALGITAIRFSNAAQVERALRALTG